MKFYASFMQKQAFKDSYVEIRAETWNEARECMFAHFGPNFMTLYNQAQFTPKVEKYKMTRLCVIEAVNRGDPDDPDMKYQLVNSDPSEALENVLRDEVAA